MSKIPSTLGQDYFFACNGMDRDGSPLTRQKTRAWICDLYKASGAIGHNIYLLMADAVYHTPKNDMFIQNDQERLECVLVLKQHSELLATLCAWLVAHPK